MEMDPALAIIHVDVGLGKLTHIVAKARLSSAFLYGRVRTSAVRARRSTDGQKGRHAQ
jgi:hypothetical protein